MDDPIPTPTDAFAPPPIPGVPLALMTIIATMQHQLNRLTTTVGAHQVALDAVRPQQDAADPDQLFIDDPFDEPTDPHPGA